LASGSTTPIRRSNIAFCVSRGLGRRRLCAVKDVKLATKSRLTHYPLAQAPNALGNASAVQGMTEKLAPVSPAEAAQS
jgi:hypothetical protein